MTELIETVKIQKKISARYIFVTFFVCISMVAWLGLSDLRADEDDPDDNDNGSEVILQNSAQEKKADDVARQAALQDPLFNEYLKEGMYDEARALYLGNVETFTDQITAWRADGRGWGWISHQLRVHPSWLGTAHTPMTYSEYVDHHKHSNIKSQSKKAQKPADPADDLAYGAESDQHKGKGLALGHSKNKSSNRGGGNGGGKGGGNGGGKGGGNGGGKGGGKK
jgi:uncharacterized membrane protein YgcG